MEKHSLGPAVGADTTVNPVIIDIYTILPGALASFALFRNTPPSTQLSEALPPQPICPLGTGIAKLFRVKSKIVSPPCAAGRTQNMSQMVYLCRFTDL